MNVIATTRLFLAYGWLAGSQWERRPPRAGWPLEPPTGRHLAADRTTQDEELAVATRLPSQRQVIELLHGTFARAGFDIEDVVIDARTHPPRITVIVDGDTALDLDTIAELSRRASTLLDDFSAGSDERGEYDSGYVLEVSSPGVERPLTSEKHFRRARGRKVELVLTDGSQLTGRVGETDGTTTTLVVRDGRSGWALREIALEQITNAVVQVEFSPPAQRELELASASRGSVMRRSGG
jgi:ribosome maturation factor RimP